MSTTLLLDPPDLKNLSTPLKGFALDSVQSKKLTKLRPILEKYQYQDCYQMKYVREHSHMTSDVLGMLQSETCYEPRHATIAIPIKKYSIGLLKYWVLQIKF